MRILQTNLGRSRRAQDLLFQIIQENAVALAVMAEPYRVLDARDWSRDTDGRRHLDISAGGTHPWSPAGARQRIRRGRVDWHGGGVRVRVAQLRMGSDRGVPGRGWRQRQAASSPAGARPRGL